MTTDHIKMLQATVDKSRATIHDDGTVSIGKPVSDGENDDFVEEIKEALEQPTQEPVGEVNANGMAWFYSAELAPKYGAKLYTHPRTGNI